MNPKELKEVMLHNIDLVLSHLLPNGKKKGREYEVGSISGEPGKSLKVRLDGQRAGVWKDFASDDGGDLIDLWCSVKGTEFADSLHEIKDFLGVSDELPKFYNAKKKYVLPKKPKCTLPDEKMKDWWAGRGVLSGTIERLKIGQKGDAIVFPYLSPDGTLELTKFRSMTEKKFWSNENPIPCLFGWQAISLNDKYVVICEGEVDAASWIEQDIPALSIPKGGGKGGKQDWIEYEYHRLDRFEDIYISMDNDEAGLAAKNDIIDRLGRHRCKIVNLDRYKDANEALLDGADLSLFLSDAATEDPEELRRITDFHDDILKELNHTPENSPGIFMPWEKSRSTFKFRPADTTVWAGINGHGKSLAISNVIVDGVAQGVRWCVASMEMPPPLFGDKLYRQIGWVEGEKREEEIRKFAEDIFIFNQYGTAKSKKILEVFEYARKRYGVDHFVIDSLTKCGFSDDDYTNQKAFADQLVEFAMKNNVHVHLVVHVRKNDSEFKKPNKFDIKGSGGICDVASNVLIVWRNKLKEKVMDGRVKLPKKYTLEEIVNQPDMILSCEKQKRSGKEEDYNLWFLSQSCQFVERSSDGPKQYILDIYNR